MSTPSVPLPEARRFGALSYWFQESPVLGRCSSLLIAVHGVRRNALEQMQAFAPRARERACHLLVPCFDGQHYPDYQRLGRPGHGQRADLHLIALVAGLAGEHGFDPSDLRLFGHSGGAQFVHRFVMAHPDMVRRYALSAPGWYTFPDETLQYPLGTGHAPAEFPRLEAWRYLRVPGRVFVGQREHAHSRLLRRNERLDQTQGRTRLDRARSWVRAMQLAARSQCLQASLDLVELPDGAHGFGGLVRRTDLVGEVLDFLFPETGARSSGRIMATQAHARSTDSACA
jgi:pimeloyl-ACP methyl ester carboxylesterase